MLFNKHIARRKLCTIFMVIVLLLSYLSVPAFAKLNEDRIIIPITVEYTNYNIEAKIYRPNDDNIYPLIIINHGRSLGTENKRQDLIQLYRKEAIALAEKGFVVVVPARRGYGNSSGKDAEHNYIFASANEGAKDVVEIANHMKGKAYVNSDKLIIMGQSAGGIVSVASASKNIPGLKGIVNFSGGLRQLGNPATNSDMAASFALLGALSNNIPMLWIYAENDSIFPPHFSSLAYNAFKDNGGQAKYVLLPPQGTDGHFLFGSGASIPTWMPLFEQFINEIGI